MTGGKQVRSPSISYAINPLVTFYDIMEERESCSFILSWTPQETYSDNNYIIIIHFHTHTNYLAQIKYL
jgi:hypothetical protein